MKATTKFSKEVLFIVALALGLALLAGFSRHGALPVAARPASQEGTPSPTLMQELPALQITKARELNLVFDADGDGKPDPGDKLRYVITYQNTGLVGATGVAIVDDYDQSLVEINAEKDPISDGGQDDKDKITWNVPDLPPGAGSKVAYVVTVKVTLNPGSYILNNTASISSLGVVKVASVSDEVLVPTPTILATSTPTSEPTLTPTPMPTSTPEPPLTGVGASNIQDPRILWPLTVLASILELGGLVILGLIAVKSQLSEEERSRVLRVGFVVTLTVGAVLIMGVFGGIERGAAAGILGTIAGYLLRGIKEG